MKFTHPKKPILALKICSGMLLILFMKQVMSPTGCARLSRRFPLKALFTVLPEDTDRVPAYTDAMLRLLPDAFQKRACLIRCLVLYAFLKDSADDLVIAVGFGKEGRLLPGHAWLEKNGAVWLDTQEKTGHYHRAFILDVAGQSQ